MVYNTSQVSPVGCQGDSVLCSVEEFLRAFVDVMQDKTVRDAEKYFDMVQEEYELVKPSRMEEMVELTNNFKTYLVEKGKCGELC